MNKRIQVAPSGAPIEGWIDQAACRDTDPMLFFPERGESHEAAVSVCNGCAVRADCLEHALRGPERFGVWGGTSERERRRIRALRRAEQFGVAS